MKTNKNKGYGFKGKYCAGCNTVWEMITNAGEARGIIRHPDFPSYGLEKQYCATCAVASAPEATPDTLAEERHKKLLQSIADENQELFKKKDNK